MADATFLSWPFFDDEHRDAGARARRLGGRSTSRDDEYDDVDAACRALVADLGRDGWLRYASRPRTAARSSRSTRARSASCARRWRATTRWPTSPSRCRAWAARRSCSAGSAELQRRYLPRVVRRQRDRRLRAVGARRRLRRRGASTTTADARRATTTCSTARRPGSPTAASPTSTSCSRAPARRRAAAASAPSSSTPTRRAWTIAERIELIAPHPLATLRFERLPHPGRPPAGRGRRGLQAGDAHARHLSRQRRGRGAGLRAARARRGARARDSGAACSAARWRTSSSPRRRSPRWRPASTPRALLTYRAAWLRDVAGRADDPRGGDGEADRDRNRPARDRPQPCSSSARSACTRGTVAERLYREIRALRIYEGASEVQQLIIARQRRCEGTRMTDRPRRHLRARPPAAARAVARVLLRRCPSCSTRRG